MKLFFKTVLVLGMLVLTAGCASEQTIIEPPSKSTLGEKPYKASSALNKNINPQDSARTIVISDTLTFSDALSKALLENSRLQSYGWQVRAREAERLQASLLPNPRLEAEMENFGGTGTFDGFDNREITIRLGQTILLGADRLKAKRLAGYNQKLAGWDYETQRLNVLTGVTQAYISALEAQQQWRQQQELVEVAQKLFDSISAQVEAGKVSPIAATRAKVELSRVRIDLENTHNTFEAARSNLASFWGSKQPVFKGLSGTLAPTDSLPAYPSLAQYIQRNPDVARWATEMQQRKSLLALERAKGIPNPTISGGYKRFEDVGAEAAVVGLSIPFPLFDRNQGDIKAAKHQIWRGRSQRQAAVTEVTRALQEAYNRLQSSYQEVQQLQEEVLPSAQSAFKSIKSGYQQGKFNYLEVLDAQRTLFTSRTRYIQALAEYNREVAEIERLIGTPLSEIPSN
jgi:cobalt-zinc-cadmium efflux system outer membrane protein